MSLERLLGKRSDLPQSLIQDPFKKDCIESITFRIRKNLFDPGFDIYATIEFQKDKTKGEQKIEASSFPELVEKVYNFLDTL